MDATDLEPARRGDTWLRKVGIYLLHMLVGIAGVFVVSGLLDLILEKVSSVNVANVVFGGPVFFGQLSLGFLLGFTFNRSLHSKSAIWVWVLPAVWLIWAIWDSLDTAWGGQGLAYLFGTKCGDCLEQVLTVCPFYGSVAYSLGSWAGLGTRR